MKNIIDGQFKHIIFDFDGTLVDSGEIAFKAINSMADKFGFRKIDWEDVDRMRTMSVNERCSYMGVSLIKLPFFAADYYAYYKSHMGDLLMYPGMEDLLCRLHDEGFNLNVISSNEESNIRDYLKKKELDVFNEIICSKHLFQKDRIINKFIKKHGFDHRDILYVGDELRDVEACKRAGIKVIWVDWGLDLFETIEPAFPDFMVSKPSEIYEIIHKGWNSDEN